MRMSSCTLAAALLLPLAATAQTAAPAASAAAGSMQVPAYVTHAMNDSARAADKKDDTRRQMAVVMTFTGAKPGDKVMELLPGSGYWTRVFSQVVKPGGHVYTVWPDSTKPDSKSWANWAKLVKTAHYSDVTMLREDMNKPHAPTAVDIVFTSENYHDLHDPYWGPDKQPVDIAAFNKAIFDALKPGGVFIVTDHMAPAGSGISDTNTLHRIDPETVKREVEAAGFVFDGSSDALINSKDPLDIKVFEPSIRGHTSQFIYRFKKPAK
ncbi:MAG TPA: methyltransferase [Rhodanobacteraceae bacterium]